ncbi:hypothetical protein DUNSADRAFT_6190 [Dunaliella salina]|uniref:Encoded protein n=1 Tax=Dunaliella salina TaxID=3046 RepID=A0ABQ7FTY6_DUNSA|nr:hypothetical protein DUNSADRAFT_6190 [Dunaliella salina]|eukprot:KAF5825883.1 hypothetical protein DUNSADRAFT_6190 [Dunaliella salina]
MYNSAPPDVLANKPKMDSVSKEDVPRAASPGDSPPEESNSGLEDGADAGDPGDLGKRMDNPKLEDGQNN